MAGIGQRSIEPETAYGGLRHVLVLRLAEIAGVPSTSPRKTPTLPNPVDRSFVGSHRSSPTF